MYLYCVPEGLGSISIHMEQLQISDIHGKQHKWNWNCPSLISMLKRHNLNERKTYNFYLQLIKV